MQSVPVKKNGQDVLQLWLSIDCDGALHMVLGESHEAENRHTHDGML